VPLIEVAPVEGITGTRLKVARGDYSFAVDGGAQSTKALMGATLIPSGAIIVGGYIEITTQLTSGGAATIACQVNAANDILTAVAVASWTAGRKNILPTAFTTGDLTASTTVKTTAARDISIVIGAADLTAGVFKVVLFYHDPQTP
jgi:hypothetical protein